MGTPGPGGDCRERLARWLSSSQVPAAAKRRTFWGNPPPAAKGYLQTGAGCSAGTRRPGAGSGGKFSRGERRAGWVTSRAHPSQGSHSTGKLRISSLAGPSARRHLETDFAGDRQVPVIFYFPSTMSVLRLNSLRSASNSTSLRGLWV